MPFSNLFTTPFNFDTPAPSPKLREPVYRLVWKRCDYSGSLYMALVKEDEVGELERVRLGEGHIF